jgi:PAS domain S-box-containing protein
MTVLKSFMRQRYLVSLLSALSILTFVIIGYVSFEHTRMWSLTNDQVSRSRMLLLSYEKLISTAKDAETGQRAYIITGDSSFLKPYLIAQEIQDNYLRQIDSLTASGNPTPQIQTSLEKIHKLSRRHQELLEYGIKKINSGDTTGRIIYTNMLQGKHLMDSLRKEMSALEAEELDWLHKREEQMDRSTSVVKLTQSFGSLFGLSLFIWVFLLLGHHIRERKKAIDELERHNDILESKVMERTSQLEVSLQELGASNEELTTTNEELNLSNSAQEKLISELTRTQEQLKLALGISKMGFWEWDMKTDRVEISGGVEALLDLQPGDFYNKYEGKLKVLTEKLIHPDDKLKLPEATIQTALENNKDFNLECRVLLPGGNLKWLYVQGRVIHNREGTNTGILGTVTDITERRLAGERIRESEERFRIMADTAPVLIWMADTDAHYTYFNKIWLDFTGRTVEQEMSQGWQEGIHPEDIQEYLHVYQTAFESHEPFRIEYRLRRADREYRYILDEGVPRFTPDGTFLGYIGCCIDIEDRKLAEQRNLKSERLLQEIFEESTDALLLIHARSNHIVNHNAQAADLFGFSNKQMSREASLFSLTKEPFSEEKKKNIINRLKARKYWTEELEFKSRTGREFWGSAAATLIAVEGGLFYLVRVTDITERRMAVEAIEKALAIIEKDNLRKTAELEEAKALQLSMLPQSPPLLDNIEMAMYMKTCTEVGGDYYDYKMDEDGRITIAIGDATGHGLKAGIVVATVKSYFQTLANQYDAVELLEQISLGIRNLQIRSMYMGLTIIKIDDRNITIASSGMPPVYLFKQSLQEMQVISLKGLFLGSEVHRPYNHVDLRFEEGDTLLVMSDGLPELFNKDRHQLDYDRVVERYTASVSLSAAGIITSLNKLAEEWVDGKSNEDDITLVVIKAK